METTEHGGKFRLTLAGWLTTLMLACLLVVSVWYAIDVWNSMAGIRMNGWGWIPLGLGVVVTSGLGAGLMVLLLCSSRHDYHQ